MNQPRRLLGAAGRVTADFPKGEVYVFGGQVQDGAGGGGGDWFTANVERLDVAANVWQLRSPLPHSGPCR